MNLGEKSKEVIWHPFTQMQTAPLPIGIVKGAGTLLWDEDGKSYIDAISSWWVTLHGHSHPYIAERVYEQMQRLEHSMLAGFTHGPAVELSQRLLQKLPGQDKVFFSDNGSTAVEVALKMVMQYWHNRGEEKPLILALENAYHGDTFGAMSAAERSAFNKPFQPYLFEVTHLPFPGADEDVFLQKLEGFLKTGKVAGFIFEPLVQGAGGMFMYEPVLLEKAMRLCESYQALTIADEVMTGFYRTGRFMATHYCDTLPDIICLSKGLTAGALPMAVTTCREKIYDAFLSDDALKTFFHGHSFTGNPVGCAAALASLDLLEKNETLEAVKNIETWHSEFMAELASVPMVKNIRTRGTILAFDVQDENGGYFSQVKQTLYPYFLEQGVILRPLGNVVYILPPYSITREEMRKVYDVIVAGLKWMAGNR